MQQVHLEAELTKVVSEVVVTAEVEVVEAVEIVVILEEERLVRCVVETTLPCSIVQSLPPSFRKEDILNFQLPCAKVV